MTVHAASIDWSPDTGSLVVCTCGLVLRPFNDYDEAKKAGREHARWTGGEVAGSDERRKEIRREYQRARHAAKKARGDA